MDAQLTDDGFDLTTTVGDPISTLSGMDMTCSSPMEVELDEWPEGSECGTPMLYSLGPTM